MEVAQSSPHWCMHRHTSTFTLTLHLLSSRIRLSPHTHTQLTTHTPTLDPYNPYVIGYVEDLRESTKQKTTIKYKTLNPKWNEIFTFNYLTMSPLINLIIEQKARQSLNKNPILAKLTIPLKDIMIVSSGAVRGKVFTYKGRSEGVEVEIDMVFDLFPSLPPGLLDGEVRRNYGHDVPTIVTMTRARTRSSLIENNTGVGVSYIASASNSISNSNSNSNDGEDMENERDRDVPYISINSNYSALLFDAGIMRTNPTLVKQQLMNTSLTSPITTTALHHDKSIGKPPLRTAPLTVSPSVSMTNLIARDSSNGKKHVSKRAVVRSLLHLGGSERKLDVNGAGNK